MMSIVQDRFMRQQQPSIILGVPASPYTRKMLAYLRFRNIPYSYISGDTKSYLLKHDLEIPKPPLLPVVIMQDELGERRVACDSSHRESYESFKNPR
jgi:hypothetical protein